MTWLSWLMLAAVVAVIAAVTGLKPRGTRHVAHTRLMGVGRVMLLIIAIILGYIAFHTAR
jgi:hypothetical protein